MTSQTGLPVAASSATSRPSSVPRYSLAFPRRDAAIDDVAAGVDRRGARHLRVVSPELASRRRVERKHLAPGGGHVHHAVDHERRRLLRACGGIEVVVPGQPEVRDVRGADPIERRITLLVVGAAVTHPVTGLAIGVAYTRIVHAAGAGVAVADVLRCLLTESALSREHAARQPAAIKAAASIPSRGMQSSRLPRDVPSDHHADGLELGVELDGRMPVLATDARLLVAAKRQARVDEVVAVDPDGAGPQLRHDAVDGATGRSTRRSRRARKACRWPSPRPRRCHRSAAPPAPGRRSPRARSSCPA